MLMWSLGPLYAGCSFFFGYEDGRTWRSSSNGCGSLGYGSDYSTVLCNFPGILGTVIQANCHMSVYIYIYIYPCVDVGIDMYVDVDMYVSIYIYICRFVHVCVYVKSIYAHV